MAVKKKLDELKEKQLRAQREWEKRREEEEARKKAEQEKKKESKPAEKKSGSEKPSAQKPKSSTASTTGPDKFTATPQQMSRWQKLTEEKKKAMHQPYSAQRERRIASGAYGSASIDWDKENKQIISTDTIENTNAFLAAARDALKNGTKEDIATLLRENNKVWDSEKKTTVPVANPSIPDINSARRGLYLSTYGSKQVADTAKEINALERALKDRLKALEAEEKGGQRYGSVEEYRKAQDMGLIPYIDSINSYEERAMEAVDAYDEAEAREYGYKNMPNVWGPDPFGINSRVAGAQKGWAGERLARMGLDPASEMSLDDQVGVNRRAYDLALEAAYEEMSQTPEVQGYKGTLQNPTWEENQKWFGPFVVGQHTENIANKATFARDNSAEILHSPGSVGKDIELMRFMDENEVLEYTFWLENYGQESADDYYKSKMPELAQRAADATGELDPIEVTNLGLSAEEEAALYAQNEAWRKARKTGFIPVQSEPTEYRHSTKGTVAGESVGFSYEKYEPTLSDYILDYGTAPTVGAQQDYTAAAEALGIPGAAEYREVMQNRYEKSREIVSSNHGFIGEVAYDISGNAARMLADSLAGGAGAKALMGIGAGMSAYDEAIEVHGMTDSQAHGYSSMVAGSEVFFNKLLSGISAIGKGVVPESVIKAISSKVVNPFFVNAIKTGASMGSEGLEEYAQSILGEVYRALAQDGTLSTAEIDLLDEEALYSSLLGILTAGVMEIPGNTINAVGEYMDSREQRQIEQNEIDLSQAEETDADEDLDLEEELEAEAPETPQEARREAPEELRAESQREEQNAVQAQQRAQEQAQQMADELGTENQRAEQLAQEAAQQEQAQDERIAEGLSTESTRAEQLAMEAAMQQEYVGQQVRNGLSTGSQRSEQLAMAAALRQEAQAQRVAEGLGTDAQRTEQTAAQQARLEEEQAQRVQEGLTTEATRAEQLAYEMADAQVQQEARVRQGLESEAQRQESARIRAQQAKAQAEEQARTAAEVEAAEMEEAPKATPESERKAGLNWSFDAKEAVDKVQGTVYRVLDEIGKRFGIEIVVDEQIADGKANGRYDPAEGKGNVIHIAADSSENSLLYVATHEIAHFIKRQSDGEYAIMRDFIIDRLTKAGVDVQARVKHFMDNLGLNEEVATEEMVAESLPTIWNNEANVRDFVEQNRSLAEKIRDYLGKIIDTIKSQIKRLSQYRGRFELDALQNDLEGQETLYDMFNAILEGVKVRREQAAEVAQAEAEIREGQERYNLKDIDGIDTDILEELARAEDVSKASDSDKLSLDLVGQIAAKSQEVISKMDDGKLRGIAKSEAQKMVKKYNSTYTVDEAAEGIFALYKAMGLSQGEATPVIQLAADIGKTVVENSLDDNLYNEYWAFRSTVKETKIRLTEPMKQEIINSYDDLNQWRKDNIGKFTVSSKGIPLDSFYTELADQYPELLPQDANEADMPFLLVDALESIKPQPRTMGSMDVETEGMYAGLEMMQDMFDNVAVGGDLPKMKSDLRKSINARRRALKKEYDQALAEVIGEDAEKRRQLGKKYKEALETYNISKSDADKASLAELMEQYKKLANKRIKLLQETKAKYKASQKSQMAAKERRKAKPYRDRIVKTANELRTWLANPTNKKHVPEFFRQRLASVLTAIDIFPKNGKETKKAVAWRESVMALSRLVNDAERARTGEDRRLVQQYEDLMYDLDPDFVTNIKALADYLADGDPIRISTLDSGQLKVVDGLLRNIMHGITHMNQTHENNLYNDAIALGNGIVDELDEVPDKKGHGKVVKGADDFLNLGQLDAFRFGKRVGKAFSSIIDSLSRGMEKAYGRVREASEYMDQVKKDLHVNMRTMRAWARHNQQFKLTNGQTITMNVPRIMELMNLWNRGQGVRHILTGGITVSGLRTKSGKEIPAKRVNVTEQDVRGIIATLTDTQRQYAEAMQRYLAKDAAAWGNETSMKLHNYEKFGEADYWPIHSDPNYLRKLENKPNQLINAFTNMGFTKELEPNASNPVSVGDALQTFSDHIGQMANYNGLAGPMQDLIRAYNYSRRTMDENGKILSYGPSVKEMLVRKLGTGAKTYIEGLVNDINGQSSGSMGVDIGSKLLRAYKRNAIAGNLRVVIQQFSSIYRALAVMEPKYLLAGTKAARKMPNSIKEMREKSGIAYWKGQGHYEIGMGKGMRDIIMGTDSIADRFGEMMMKPAGMMDDAAWSIIWEGCKAQVKGENPNIEIGSTEYWEAVKTLYSQVVNETQVVDSVLHRSQNMREKKGFLPLATMFLSEPTKQYNMFYDALRAVYRGEEGAKEKLVRTTIAVTASIVANNARKALYDALTRRDEDEDVLEKALENFTATPLEWANEYLSLPYLNDILEILQGYDVERADMAVVRDVWNAVQDAMKMLKGESKKNPYQVTSSLVKTASAFTKVPLNGLLTSAERIVNAIAPGTLTWTQSGIKDNAAALYKLIMEGDKKGAEALRKRIQTAASEVDGKQYNKMGYIIKSNREIDTELANLLALGDEERKVQPDERIAQAWAAKQEYNTSEVARLKKSVMDDGFTGEMFDRALNVYANAQKPEEPAGPKDITEELDQALYGRADFVGAMEKGSAKDAEVIMDEIMADSTAKDPANTVKNYVTKGTDAVPSVKDMYVDAYMAGDSAQMRFIRDFLTGTELNYDPNTIDKWVTDTVKNRMYEALDAGNDSEAGEMLNRLLDDELMTQSGLLSSLNNTYAPQWKDMYFSGDTAGAEELRQRLETLWPDKFGTDYVMRNWGSSKERRKWEEKHGGV